MSLLQTNPISKVKKVLKYIGGLYAYSFTKKLANRGDELALFHVAKIHEYGNGFVKPNLETAYFFYLKSFHAGCEKAREKVNILETRLPAAVIQKIKKEWIERA